MFKWIKITNRPIIIAHRGASAVAPENTVSAFLKAVETKADAVELDIRITCDNEIVVIHDSRLDRTTNGHGRVSDFTLEEIKKLDAGSWFHSKFYKEQIPTFSEIIESLTQKVGINIEIKPSNTQQNIIIRKCVELIQKNKLHKRVLISSFQHRLTQKIKLIDKNILTGIIYSPMIHLGAKPANLVTKYKADAFIISKNYLRENIVRDVQSCGAIVLVYTVENYDDFRRMSKFGVDGVMTNSPSSIYKMINF